MEKLMEKVSIKGIGRPRVKITTIMVLNAYGEYRSVRAAARFLNISSGTAWQRLKEAGVTPLGMTPSEAGAGVDKLIHLSTEQAAHITAMMKKQEALVSELELE